MVIGFIVVGAWAALTIIVVSLCHAAGRADDALSTAFMFEDAVRPRARRRAPASTREAGSRVLPLPR